MMMSAQERRILVAAQFHAAESISSIAARARVKPHVANYALKRLADKGIIRRGILVSPESLSLRSFQIFFSLQGAQVEKRARLLSACRSNPFIVWCGELGGSFQYGITLTTRSPLHALEVFTEIIHKLHLEVSQKSVATILRFSSQEKILFLRGLQHQKARQVISIGGEPEPLPGLSTLDREILSKLTSPNDLSHRDISRALGIPRSTIDRHIKILRESGIIKGEVFFINSSLLGLQTYRFLLSMRGPESSNAKRIASFSLRTSHVVNWSYCFGEWDFELGIEALTNSEVTHVTDLLLEAVGDSLSKLTVLPVFSQSTSTRYLTSFTRLPHA